MSSAQNDMELTVADVVSRFGALPVSRLHPTCAERAATVDDVIAIHDHENRLCELVDGLLVEKTMGSYESMIAIEVAMILGQFIRQHERGRVLGADGMLQLCPGLVRIPDVSFISKEKLSRICVEQAVWQVAPDLAVEVLSTGNTVEEMDRKLKDYFANAVGEVWYVDPARKLITIYESVSVFTVVHAGEKMNCSRVFVGLEFNVADLFVGPR